MASFDGNPTACSDNRDNVVIANVGVPISGSLSGEAVGLSIDMYSASGIAVSGGT